LCLWGQKRHSVEEVDGFIPKFVLNSNSLLNTELADIQLPTDDDNNEIQLGTEDTEPDEEYNEEADEDVDETRIATENAIAPDDLSDTVSESNL